MATVERPLLKPEKLKSRSYPSADDINNLGEEMREARISDATKVVFAELAVLKPADRLASNLRTLVGLMAKSPIYHVLTEGLLPEEHAALVELDLHVLSLSARETAHGLLNIHERWCAAKELRRLFKQASLVDGGYVVPAEEGNGKEEEESTEGGADD
jgi:hypothetical protein